MQRTILSGAIQAALAAPPDAAASYREHAKREALKAELDRIKGLVDAGRLGCIILTELLDDEGSQVRSAQYGNPGLVLQTAIRIVQRASAGVEDGQVPLDHPVP